MNFHYRQGSSEVSGSLLGYAHSRDSHLHRIRERLIYHLFHRFPEQSKRLVPPSDWNMLHTYPSTLLGCRASPSSVRNESFACSPLLHSWSCLTRRLSR